MKNIIKTLVLTTLMVSTVMSSNSDTTDFIVSGVILKTNNKLGGKCKLELFKENTLVETSEIKMNRLFELGLRKNTWYMIRVTKEGYVPLMISLNTEVGDSSLVLDNLFEFETTLLDTNTVKNLNKELLSFPVGLVRFNKVNHKFETNDTYTRNYMMNLYKQDQNASNLCVTTPFTTPDIVKEYVTKGKLVNDIC